MNEIEIDPETNMPKIPSDMYWEVYGGSSYTTTSGKKLRSVLISVRLIRTKTVKKVRKWDELVTEVIEVPCLWFWTKKVEETHEVPRWEETSEEEQELQEWVGMYQTKASENTTEPGWVSQMGSSTQSSPKDDFKWQGVNFWYKPEELTDENVQKAAIKCLTEYWDKAYDEAIAEDRQRTTDQNRDRILGKYGPQKLMLEVDA